MTIEQQLRQAIADEKESFKKYHAKHQSRLNQLKSKLKHERNRIRTSTETKAV
jgi:hypothetical protein